MTTNTTRDISRQPVWVQDMIHDLRRQRDEARAQVTQLSTAAPEGSNVRVQHYGVRPDQLLGKDTPVTFDLPGGTVTVKHTGTPGVLEIYCTSQTGGDYFPHISPQSANVVRLRLGAF